METHMQVIGIMIKHMGILVRKLIFSFHIQIFEYTFNFIKMSWLISDYDWSSTQDSCKGELKVNEKVKKRDQNYYS